ncbi:MAG: class I SAM-dependent RNA methyltransferase [Elusimicrobia bacterium]|nr:class I SAM-dependent RNA methyltransferase [Elusimicrobiota bacterium]
MQVEFTKISDEGRALGRHSGKLIFAYGVLPGETAKVRIIREKRNFIEAELLEIIRPSEKRRDAAEDHYLSCSPWQIMDYAYQTELKKNIIEDFLYRFTRETIKLDGFYPAERRFGYRTKIEYSFAEKNNEIHLAFHKRGSFGEKHILENGCALIAENTNKIALKIVEILNRDKTVCSDLKTLILRESQKQQQVVAALYVKNRGFSTPQMQIDGLDGFLSAYSNPLSPVSAADEILYKNGIEFMTEKVGNLNFSYPFDCFFQNNIPLFEKAMEVINGVCFECNKLMDLFCGAGVMAIILKDAAREIIGVESFPGAAKFAQINSAQNNVKNFQVLCSPAEKTPQEVFDGTDIIVMDPPRPGLHKKTVKALLNSLPQRIIYLSCNPATQARDAAFFLEKYKIIKAFGFDFYPNTPHVESLLVFDKQI